MRIGIFFHRFDDGGAEKTTVRLANELAKRGHAVTIAVRYDRGPARALVSSAVRVVDMKLPEKGKLVKNIRNVRILKGMMGSGDYDVLMAVTSEMAEVAAVSCAFGGKKIPLVCVLHSTLSVEQTSFRALRHMLHEFFDRQYDRVIAVSEAVRLDYLKSCGAEPDKAVTIYNPLVDERVMRLSGIRPDHPWLVPDRIFRTLLMVGRLSYPKNHALMFRVLKKLLREGDYRLVLLGEGELREELETLAEDMGIRAQVDFAGYTDNPFGYMAYCDCLVLSSHYEGLPSVLVEGLACAATIVSVDCPSGPAEILEGGTYGVLVKSGDEEALKEGILEALQRRTDPELLRRRSEDFSVSGSVDRYESVLLQTVEDFRKGRT